RYPIASPSLSYIPVKRTCRKKRPQDRFFTDVRWSVASTQQRKITADRQRRHEPRTRNEYGAEYVQECFQEKHSALVCKETSRKENAIRVPRQAAEKSTAAYKINASDCS